MHPLTKLKDLYFVVISLSSAVFSSSYATRLFETSPRLFPPRLFQEKKNSQAFKTYIFFSLVFFSSLKVSVLFITYFCSFTKCWSSVPVSMILCFTVKADERTFVFAFEASARVLIKGKLRPQPRVHLIIPLDEIFRNVILRMSFFSPHLVRFFPTLPTTLC